MNHYFQKEQNNFISVIPTHPNNRQKQSVACIQIIVSNHCQPYNQNRISRNQFFIAEVGLKIIIQSEPKNPAQLPKTPGINKPARYKHFLFDRRGLCKVVECNYLTSARRYAIAQ